MNQSQSNKSRQEKSSGGLWMLEGAFLFGRLGFHVSNCRRLP